MTRSILCFGLCFGLRSGLCLRRTLVRCAALLLGAALSFQVVAWNSPGHQAIALAGFEQLAPPYRTLALADLQAHPRFQPDIAALANTALGPGALFAAAAVWPDVARGFDHLPWWRGWQRAGLVDRYHRGRWHYVNFPLYLTPDDAALAVPEPAVRASVTTAGEEPAHILEALALARATIVSSSDPAERGLMLAWALHLIADSHQPLHAVALFSEDRWPRGDRGGNEVRATAPGLGEPVSLHYYWDQALLNRGTSEAIRALATELQRAVPGTAQDLRPRVWVRESAGAGGTAVYAALRAQLRLAPTVTLDEAYVELAGSVARARGALAGARTAGWIAQVYRERTAAQR